MNTYNEVQHNCIAINQCLIELRETMHHYSFSIETLGYADKFESLLNNMQIIHSNVQDEMIRQEQGLN